MMMADTTIGGVPGVRLGAKCDGEDPQSSDGGGEHRCRSMAREVNETVYSQRRCVGGIGLGVGGGAGFRVPSNASRLINSGGSWATDAALALASQLPVPGGAGGPRGHEFADQARTAQQIRPMRRAPTSRPKTAYKTPTTVKGNSSTEQPPRSPQTRRRRVMPTCWHGQYQ